MLAIEPVRRPADARDRLRIVDGTLILVRDRQVGASSRNRRFSANVREIIDAATNWSSPQLVPRPATGQTPACGENPAWPNTART
ncbi:hypothetical protein ACFVFJ_41845 [Streptomyces sp. NPDC057717]|uniref:hypothetical protein n=1 Tax=Streptomyces sp. NPDC057717 TaxID=3346224 RepID=UPI0036A48295